MVLHKFQTQVNTFLSARTPEGRWAATILIKAAIEVGAFEVLSKSSNCVRGLLQNLNKPDPASSKKLIIITLTRMFLLTRDHQTLIRELTTPSLKDFITICLNLISSKATGAVSDAQKRLQHILKPTVLDSFAHLIPSHPSIFRPHISQIKEIILATLSSEIHRSRPDRASDAAERLFALLHFSASKTKTTSPAEAYLATLNHALASLHVTVSLVFRSVIEDWSPLPSNDAPNPMVANEAQLDSSAHADPLGLPAWRGIQSGIARLYSLLSLLQALLRAPSSEQVSIPVGNTLDMIIRLCSTTAPQTLSQSKTTAISLNSGIRPNDQISQTERDALFTELPGIHASAIDTMSTLCTRLVSASKPLHATFIEQIVWVYQREGFNAVLRTSCYIALASVLDASGAGITKSTAQQCIPILNRCCEDIMSSVPASNASIKESLNGLSADSLAPQKTSSTSHHAHEPTTAIVAAAENLLYAALKSVPPSHIPSRVRSQLDRTAILTQNKDAILASVLNPALATKGGAKTPASILPFLARADPQNLATEALLRPRMPAIRTVEAHEMSGDEFMPEVVGDESSEDESVATTDAVNAQTTNSDPISANATEIQLGSVPEAPQQAPSPGSSNNTTKRAASPPASDPEINSVNAAKRQRLTLNTPSQNPPPKRPAEAVSHPVVMPNTSFASTRDHDTVAGMPTPSAGSTVPHGPNTAPSATGNTAIAAEDSDDDFTIPEISLELDTEDEEDDQEDGKAVDDADSE